AAAPPHFPTRRSSDLGRAWRGRRSVLAPFPARRTRVRGDVARVLLPERRVVEDEVAHGWPLLPRDRSTLTSTIPGVARRGGALRSEEHTSELQSRENL